MGTAIIHVLPIDNMSNQNQPVFPTQQQPNLNSAPFPQLFVKPFNSPLQIKRNVITDDFSVTSQVLGMGINGRVLEIFHKESGEKYALKVNTLIFVNEVYNNNIDTRYVTLTFYYGY